MISGDSARQPPTAAPNEGPRAPDPERVYAQRRDVDRVELARLGAANSRYANMRAVVFLAGVVLAVLLFMERLEPAWWWAVGASAVAYVILVILHNLVFSQEERCRRHLLLNERGLARLGRGWHDFPDTGERFLSPSHLYASDLDVFGQGSLFQLINETATRAGEERLAAWLSGPASAEEVAARQGAAQELAPRLDFRQRLCVEAWRIAREKADPGRLVQWAEAGPWLVSIRWTRVFAIALPVLTPALFACGWLGWLPYVPALISLAAQLGLVAITRRPLSEMERKLSGGVYGFVPYEQLFACIEQEPLSHPELRRLQGGFQPAGSPPVSTHFARFRLLYSLVELKNHQLHPIVHLLTLWHLHALFAVERWRVRHGAHLRDWFDALADLEALCCLAGLAHDRPGFCWPRVEGETPMVRARELGHPLLDAPVLNDVALAGAGQALLVTGSNMSGKTTMLRSMGLNAVLALAGGPVCAAEMSLSPLQVMTSMRIKDSLERGVSYFYAEVQRIKALLDAAGAAGGRVLFLLDEIFLGTNTRERQIAAREVIRLLLETGACGAFTTHDLSLAELADEHPGRIINVYFSDHIAEGKMVFDYRMRPGVVSSTNALRVLRMAGVPIEEPAAGP